MLIVINMINYIKIEQKFHQVINIIDVLIQLNMNVKK